MKHFFVHKEMLRDLELLTRIIKQFIVQERIPYPVSVRTIEEHGDCFIRNEIMITVSSLALIKSNP